MQTTRPIRFSTRTGITQAFAACSILFAGLTSHAESLTLLNPPTGIRLIGTGPGDETSRGINFIGDINGDGRGDIAIGAPMADRTANDNAGKVYVVFGTTTPFVARDFNPSALNGSNGFTVLGALTGSGLGAAIVGIGDFNGDSRSDFAVSAIIGGVNGPQSVFVIYGKPSFTATLDLATPPVGYGFNMIGSGAGVTQLGVSLAGGNFNNDAFGDVVVTEYNYTPPGQNLARGIGTPDGRVLIVFGQAGGTPSAAVNLDVLANSTSPRAASITGPQANSRFGFSVYGSNDVNGDGIGDLLVGAPFSDTQVGRAYVVFGRNNANPTTLGFASTQSILSFTAATGMELTGANSPSLVGGRFGTSVVSADLSGDGKLDIVVGAQTAAASMRNQSGAVLVMYGTALNAPSFSRAAVDVINAGGGFGIGGAVAGNFTATAMGSPGDVSGDGIDDLLIGAHGAIVNAQAAAGQFYIFYGNRTPFAVNNDLAILGPESFELWTGESAQAAVGFSMASQRGDFNGDGRLDVLVGGLRVDTTATDVGAGYLLLKNATNYFANGFENSVD
jgi:hypothetical protein